MAKILIASIAETTQAFQQLLKGHDLTFTFRMAEAEQLLHKQSFDGIVCTILFDESRMFDFLRLAKSKTKLKDVPFVCAKIKSAEVPPEVLESIAIACKRMGAAAFLNLADYQGENSFCEAVERALDHGAES